MRPLTKKHAIATPNDHGIEMNRLTNRSTLRARDS
jgi:hypothetical protein